jgi:hypothetical protein
VEDVFEQIFPFALFVCFLVVGWGVGGGGIGNAANAHPHLSKPDIPVPTITTFSLQPFVSINNPTYEIK